MAEFALNIIRFEDIRQGVVDYLKEYSNYQGTFDFDGSNISYMIESMSYIAMLLSYQNVQKSNNIFLDTTEIRKNAISIAKTMGYRPKRKISSQFTGTMEYYGDESGQVVFASDATVTIPANSIFTSSPSGYTFTNLNAITLRYVNDVLLQGDFILTEGSFEYVTLYGTGLALQSFTVNSVDVEENNLNVYIRASNTSRADNTQWTYAPSFFQIVDDDDVFFIEEDIKDEYKPKIIFGNGTLGNMPAITETIEIEYLKTKGSTGNDETGVTPVSYDAITTTGGIIFDYTKFAIAIPAGQKSYGGEDAETIEQINFNANRFYSTGGRGVIKSDIIALLSRNDSSMKDYNVESGPILFPEDEDQRGITYITAVPASLDEDDFLNNAKLYLSEIEEAELRPTLDGASVISTNRVFSKPTYLYIDVNPFIEVPDTFSPAEKTAAISTVYTNLNTHYDDELNGLGESLKFTKFLAAATNTAGIVNADLEITHHFIVNYDTFYTSKSTFLTLPVLFQKDTNGRIVYDSNNNPLTTNFVKKRDDIISYENSSRIITDNYDQFTLPVSLSPIYGELTHAESDRFMYNVDIQEVEFVTFQMIDAGDTKVLSFEALRFENKDGNDYIPNLYELSNDGTATVWQVQLNSRLICKLTRTKATDTFAISAVEEAYLTETVGILSELGDNSDLIDLSLVGETSETGIYREYYSLKFLVENDEKSDIRIYSKNQLCLATIDNHAYTWSISESNTFNGGLVTFAVGSDDLDNVVVERREGANTDILFELTHYNGAGTLDNYNDDYLILQEQRNDLIMEENYTITQDEDLKTYELSTCAATTVDGDGESVQIITLNATKQVVFDATGNSSEVLDGTYFKIWSAEDETEYWIWFYDAGGTAYSGSPYPKPDAPNDTIEIIEVTLTGITAATAVAARIKIDLDANPNFAADIEIAVDSDELTFDWLANGKSTDIVDGIDLSGDGGIDRSTGFDFTTVPVPGGSNVLTDIQDILVGDFVTITGDGQSADNLGTFEVKEVDYTSVGTLTLYNRRGDIDITGIGEITHWTLTDGTFGEYLVSSYDTFHNISIGTMNYSTGELSFKDTVKGYTDFENKKFKIRNVRDTFNNYTGTTYMDKIKIVPIDLYTASGSFLGQNNSYDGRFNQYLIANITQPTAK